MTQEFKVGDKVAHEVYGDGEVKFGPFRGLYGPADERYAVEFTTGAHMGRTGVARAGDMTLRPEFEIGAAVLHEDGTRNKIVAGPFKDKWAAGRPWYVLEDANGDHESASAQFLTPAPVDEPLKVGDRVRVVEDDPEHRTGQFVGLTGKLVEICGTECMKPFKVVFGDGSGDHGDKINGAWYCAKVERVDEPPTLKIGGRARVLVNYPLSADLVTGDEVTVTRIDSSYTDARLSVRASDGMIWRVTASQLEALSDEQATTFQYDGVAYDLTAKYRDKDGDVWRFSLTERAADATPTAAMYDSAFGSESLRDAVRAYGPLTRVTT